MLKVGFIGAGKMAEALIRAMATTEDVDLSIIASDIMEDRLALMDTIEGVTATPHNKEVVANSDVIFIAVKPQMIDDILEEMKEFEKLVVSIAAGIGLEQLESGLPRARVIRIMPNTPCLVGEMAGGFALGSRASEEDAQLLLRLTSNAGRIYQLDENLMDAVTALSGSGPAFVAYIVKAMADAGAMQGLPEDVALELAVQTVMGTGKLLRDMKLDPDTLITMVSSPGGSAYRNLSRRALHLPCRCRKSTRRGRIRGRLDQIKTARRKLFWPIRPLPGFVFPPE